MLLCTLVGFVLVTGTISMGNFESAQNLDLKTPGGNQAFCGDGPQGALLILLQI